MANTDALEPDAIAAGLKTRRIGRKILVYNRTSSSNDIAAEYARNTENDGLVVFAEEQTAGRGRAGARWFTGRGDSILCSVVLTDCSCGTELLSLAAAVAVAEAIGEVAGSHARIKWPNDIRLGEKKVAGILLESKTLNEQTVYIVGIGINCHQNEQSFPPELQGAATSIDIEGTGVCDRISLAKRLLASLDQWLEAAQKSSRPVTDRWRELSIQLGHRVLLVYNGRRFSGNCIGVDPQKGLIVQLDRGGVRMFDAAHTSIVRVK